MIVWLLILNLLIFLISSYTIKYNLFFYNELSELHCSSPCDENSVRTIVNNFTSSTLTINEDGYLAIRSKPLGRYCTGFYGSLTLDKHTIHAGDSRTDFWAATFSTIEYPKLSCTSLPHYEFLEDNGLDVSMAEKI